ncbi:dystonin isoform X13 [Polypterus senegalus]|uniref:dystonin isoform X13 n=1 Tax=Polypterus senegalus TaxID=55291 RepID=UPI001963FED0|nr:dystonin isoform X13 [Polypterus senegalus]
MGNVCGCVRSTKEEYYKDPAKAPISHGKYSRSRRYFRRRKKRVPVATSVGDQRLETAGEDGQWDGEDEEADGEKKPDSNERDREIRADLVEDAAGGTDEDVTEWGDKGVNAFTQGEELANLNIAEEEELRNTKTFGLRSTMAANLDDTLEGSSSPQNECNREKTASLMGTEPSRVLKVELGKETPHSCCSVPASGGALCQKCHNEAHRPACSSSLEDQISDIHVTGESEDMTAKERLLLWSQQSTDGYVGVRCENFTTCWRDGRLFNAIIHKYRPDLIDMNMVASQCSRINLEQAFNVAEQLGVARLLDPEDVDVQSPDEKSVITYVSTLYDVFPKVLEGSEGINANDVDIKWVEYQNMVNYLSQWIKHHVTVMSDRTYPNSPVELKALYNQYLKFKESEIPLKENEKARIKHLYRLLEPWIEFGRIKLPQGYHPNDVEKEWGKLIIAMLEREKSLRPEVERLEMLQQIANRVQRDCVAGEDKLILARNALQSDAKRLESGIQFQNEAEIAGYLLECETLLRQQVVDIQILLDGKFYLADQLVQRVSKIRDDLFTLKSECSSVYSKGRSLTTEQTKRMISGITQSLNSGFSQSLSPSLPSSLSSSLTPSLMPGLSPGLTSSYTSSLTPSQTPSLTPGITPGLQSPMVPSYLGGMDSGSLQTLKLMQIRKPLLKSSLADPSLTEEEVNMKFVQDLLNWVEEMQLQLDRAEWGSDLQSVESHFENHKNVHGAIEEFQMSLKEAKISEIQMTPPLKHSYSEKLGRLESQYGKLLNTSRNRQKHLDTLHEFVSKATRELIWLNEKEEEEVSYDWSDRSSNLAKKKDYHADLMRILDDKERVIKSVQEMAEQLLLENHPARLTIEAYRAAMQTQWSWVLQLCGCVEQHLKENTLYFEFFSDARESMDYLKNLQETIQRKYSCDRTSSLHKLEDLIQESMDEKEQLLQYRSTVASLVGRAKAIVQLKLRSPDSPIRTSIPVKAICDYRQIEITIYKDDECVLASNSHRAKWKIISPTGNEAMVPSVCFTIPPPNKEAIEYASRIEQLYQNVLALWHQSHINMKSVVSWRYLMNDIEAIRNGKVASIKTMLPGEHQQVLSNLQTHFEDFLDDTEESEIFTVSDRNHLEREVEICKQYYEELLKSAEREEHEESVYNLFISDMRNFRMRLESCEERLIRQIRTPLQRDDLQESALRIAEQEKSKKELDRLKEDLETMKGKCEMFLNQASASPSASTLSSELNLVVQNMNQIYSMSAIYLEKLKTVNLVVKNSQAAEALVKLYEAKLCEEDAVNADAKAIESVMGTLKQWRTEIDEKREVFHDLEDELQKARTVSERMFKTHNERDFDLDWHKEKADQLAERWQSVHSQVESRLRDLEGISKSLRYYKDTYFALNDWIKEMEATQLRMQENQPEDSKALAELLNQQKVLVSEIEVKQSKIDECQKYSEQYSAAVKDYELQLMTYRAMVDSQHKSPVKRRRMQSSSDMIIQEFMDLRTCYTALVTLMTQYIKYASETLKRTEEEEYSSEDGDFYMELLYGEAEDEFLCTGLEMKNTMRAFLPPDTLNNERDADLETAEDYFLTQRKDELEFAPLEGNSGDGEHTKGQFSGNSEKLQRVMCASQISDTGQQNLQEVYASENSRAKLNFRVCDAHRQLGRMFEDVGGKIDSPKGEGTSLTLEKEPDFGMWKSLCGDPEETWRRFSFTSPIGKESIMDLDAILQIIEDGDELNAYQEMLISREQMKRDRVIQERLQIVLDRMEDCYFSSDLCSDTEERWFHPNFKKDSMILGCEPLPGLEITYDEYLNVGSSLFGFPLETIPEEILESESQQTSLQSSKKSFCVKQVPKAETYKGNAKNTPHLVEEAQSLDQATSLKSVETTPGYHLRAINSDSMASGLQEEKMLWWPNGAFLEEDLGEENVVTILDGSQAFTEQQSSGFSSFIKDHEEKSVEEEKKEHGEKVNKLLNWVSRVKKEERPLEDGTNEPSYMPQVSMEDVARKKEQISEALRATQMILTKHSDKMTEEEKQETKEQLKSLQQAYNDLSQQPLDQLHQPQSLPAEQTLAEKQKEYTEKLEEMCHLLTQTENRIIGHQQTTLNKDSLGDLQQYQTEHQALQRDVQAGQSALAEIVKSSNKFLEENQGKLHPDQVALIESRVDEAKRKSKLLSQRAEESRKELDKALTTAIKQETAKVAAEEQLEDSKNKIKGLLGWLSNIGKDQGVDENLQEQMVKQNGNLPLENRSKLNGQEDDANGNLPQLNGQTCTVTDGKRTGKDDLDLSKQHDRVKAHHREILSQQQAFIIATQSAQALLEKQGHMLSPGEKEKLQSNIQELRDRYETTLTEAELKMKLIQTVQDELQKFRTDCGEFENWLQQSETEIAELKSGVSDQDHLNSKLQRQKSFSDDVISHKGDLRFITISGQRVLDAAKMCNKSDTSKDSELSVDTSGVSTLVQDKLESAANHYKSLHSQCYLLGNNLKDVVEKYKHYGDASSGIVTWLEDAEETARKQLAEVIAVDPQDLQKQLEDTKVLHGQVSGRQGAIEKLRKAADAVIATEGNLLTNCDEIQRSVGDVVERYDNLAKSVSDRNETLQITLTRSLSVQDGLDEMLDWMKNVEKSLEEQEQVPLHSTAIQEALSKEAMLEQDIVSRQSSIAAMKEKVSKFIETADPSTASSLQAKMNTLSKRFTDASQKHREKVHKLEELKDKVDMFEKTAEKVQQFVAKGSRTLTETDGPGKNVNELSQLMQETNAELTDQAKDIEVLQKLSAELADLDPDGSHSHIQKTIETLSRNFKDFEDTVKEKEEEVSSCQGQLQAFKNTVESLQRWLDESTEKLAMVQPSCSVEEHEKSLQTVKALSEEWTAKAPAVEDVNRKGSEVCNLISVLTSPAKTKSSVKAGKAVVNGSGPHGYLTNKELMLVQQHLTYVNQSYDNLGEHLKEKRGELEGALQDLSVVHNEGDSLKQWLTDMQKEVTSWNTGQAGNESVKTQMEQHKSLEVELKVKQGQLQQLKEKLSDLLEKHPQSSEAEKWKQMLDQIDSTWKDVTSSMEERKEKLEESSRNLAQFQTNEEQLKQWLAEKELMLGVLGPLSIDPNMLKAQKQQVQILLKEFDSRKSQYEQLKEAAQSILSQPGDLSPSCTAVKSQLAAITDKWEGVTGQLTDRSDRIDEAIVKTSQFQEVLRNLSEQVNALGQSLGGPSSLSTQPDAVKQQLETAMDVRSKLDQEKTRVAEAEALCKELSALVGEEYLKADLSRQLESILKPFKDLEEKAGNRIEQLNLAFASSQQFNQMSRNFHEWLDGKVQDLSKVPPLSANMEVLHRRIKEHATYQTSLEEQSGPYKKIVQEGEALLQTTQGAERTALQNQLATLQGKWDTLRKQSADYSERAQVCLKQAQKYKEHLEKVQPWIEDCEKQLTQVTVSVDPAEVDCSISRARTLQKDVDKHRGVVELFHNAADSLLEVTQADHEPVKEEKANVTQKVENISEILQQKRDTLDKIAQRLKEFNDTHKEVREHLKGARQQLTVHESLGAQVYSNKHLTNMKAQQKALETLGTQVGSLKGLAQGLVVDASDAAGVSDLLLKVESLDTEFKSVKQQVEDVSSFLETKLQGIGQFQNSIREMFSQFSDLDDELDSMQPVGRDLDVLRLQKEDMRNFIKKLQELIDNTATANKNCQQMLEKEGSPDLPGLKRDLEALNKQCGKLMDRAKGRQDQVEAIYSRVDEFYQKLKELSEKCIVVEEHEESQGAVRMEIEIVNQQLDAFKVFQKEEIEPLQGKLQDVNWIGQGLIQSAAKTTNTQKLEQDLEDINMRCNTLNKKVAERAALLHEALLHCGRFQDALESLLSWLTDTEELVANQKPPSAEFKVVKAQIQEQKLLQRLLEDRKPTVDIIKREGEKISASVESPDKEKTLKELVTLGQRWESLLGKAETRHRQLECILVVAQQFHETLEPLTEWLTSMEKRLANTEPIGTQTKKLEEQISQHKALEDDIMAHSKNLHQAISVGQTLKTLSSPDDKDSVQSKVDSAQSQFGELQETSGRKAAMLQQAFSNAQHFGEDEVALMNWLSEVHEKLSNVAVHDYHPDLLQKQDAEQRGLHVDIIQKKQNVDLAIQNGLELLKQTTGDEVLIIQEKLDGIKARYAEINTMSGNVSKLLNQALTLSTRLFQTHEELCQWLGGVEAEVVTFEAQVPVGEQLSQVQERQKDLLKDVKDHKALVSSLNEVSSSLLELVPWRAREGLDKLVSEDNERYKLVSDALVHHVEEIDATILRSQQFEQAADVEFAWLSDMETKLLSQGDIRLEQDQTTSQLQAQKAFSMDILRHKDNIDEILKKGEAMLDNSDEEEKASLKEKIRQLLEKYDVVSHINSERCLQLERAHSLASQFWETYDELWPWLQDIISVISQLPAPAIEYETLKQQQEELRQMRELIAEHKPHIDKMNKTGPQLLQLSPTEGLSIQEKYTASDQLYAQIKENVKQRAAALDEAMSKSTQLNEFHDKIDPMLETLKRIVERLRTPPSISVEVEKIKEQINENKNVLVDLEKLQPVFETLKQRGQEMIARSEGADKDVSAKAVQEKLDLMVFIWEDIHALLEERETKLLDVMDLAEKFWCDHSGLIATIKDTQDLLRELEEPGVDPSVVKQQQETAESFGEEIEGLQEELDAIQNLGDELMSACGEPDKPVIKKSIDELNTAFDNLNKNWKERMERLEEAMQSAVQFQDGLQGMFDWVDILEGKIDSMSPVGTDLETVKQQIVELKEFKAEAYQLQIEMEKLNHQAELLLKKVVEEDDKHAIQDPFTELKLLWDNLDEKIVNRQHKLEDALLALGQFQHALDELLTWMTHTEELLNEQKKTTGDPKAIEIELAKHHVLQNDVLAHKTTVEAVNIAGNDLIESSAGEEASNLQNKLESLKQRWEKILEKTEQRRQQLDSALLQAQGFHGEIEDMQHWLKETERQLLASKGVGGLPETAREQLNVHLELCGVFELKEELYKKLMAKGEQLIAICPESHDSNTQQDLLNLREKWESVQAKMTERKVKLEEALTLATEFHNSLQDFINWLTQAEQTLTMATSPSLIMDTILFQIDEHKVFVTEVNSHRDQIIELDKTGTHLKYFSQKQDVVLIKNLLISVQSRWEKVVQRSVERGRTLDDARKRAKQFSEAWNKLMEWLEESEKALDSELEIANDPDKIKLQLAQHKEFQKALGAKHSMYDTTLRSGRSLKEKTSLNDDNQKLDDMLSELRDKWDTVCGKSVERCVERFVIQAEVIHSKSCK